VDIGKSGHQHAGYQRIRKSGGTAEAYSDKPDILMRLCEVASSLRSSLRWPRGSRFGGVGSLRSTSNLIATTW